MEEEDIAIEDMGFEGIPDCDMCFKELEEYNFKRRHIDAATGRPWCDFCFYSERR